MKPVKTRQKPIVATGKTIDHLLTFITRIYRKNGI